MAFQLSPGINVSEIDLTTAVPSVSTTTGAFAGVFNWGPANTVVTITDEVRLADTFGKPDDNNYEYWFSAANFLAYSNNLKVVRAANASSTLNATANGAGLLIENEEDYLQNHSSGSIANGSWAARYPGDLGNSLLVSVCTNANSYTENVTQITVDAGSLATGNYTVSNAVTLGATTINYGSANAGNFAIQNVASYFRRGDLISLDGGGTTFVVDTANGTAITLQGAVTKSFNAGSPMTRYWRYYDQFQGAPGTSTYAAKVNGSNDELHVVVIDEDGRFTGTANTVLEKFDFVSKASDAKDESGNSLYYKNVINARSRYVWWLGHGLTANNWGNTAANRIFVEQANTSTQGTFTANAPLTVSLTSGNNGVNISSSITTAVDKFKNADTVDISLIITGPSTETINDYIISNIAESRKDCVVFISPEKADVVDNAGDESTDVVSFRDTLTSSSYAFMDCNWKYQYDKYNDVYRWVPLNGDIAGLCVRTDSQRDPWFSPAGVNRGIIKNVVKLAWNPTKGERDDLYNKGINPVVTFPGEGTILYGDKTLLSRPSAFDRINVRRLFITLEKAIARAARSSLFEFNDQFTRAQFVNLVEPYLRDVQGRRGITDFRVVCDDTNNTGEVIDRNEFIGDIYIKPARSVNFIQLNFVATRTGVSFDEVVGRF